MSFRIRTNVSSLTAQRNLSQNIKATNESFEKLSSGYRINKSKDDAAGLAISENLKARTRGLGQAKRNANDGISLIQIAEGGMNEVANILVRMRELSVQAASDTVGDKEREFLNREFVALGKEIDRIAATTEFNGNKLFDGEKEEFVVQVGVNGTEPDDNQDTISLDVSGLNFNTGELGLDAEEAIGGDGVGRENAVEILTSIDDALSRVASERASIGAMQSRMESTITSLDISIENESAAMSRIKDADFSGETAKMAQSQIMQQASVSVLSNANASADQALALLR